MLLAVLLIDPLGISRVDLATLPQQALMELVVQSLPKKCIKQFRYGAGGFRNISEWFGVTLNPNGEVIQLLWTGARYSRLNLRWVPTTVERLFVPKCTLTGEVAWENLPSALLEIALHVNALEGSVLLHQFPHGTRKISLYKNAFSGSLQWTRLPASLELLRIYSNELSGSVDLTRLPRGLVEINAGDNVLSGTIDLTAMPQGFQKLCLANNPLNGKLDLASIPHSVETILLVKTAFSGQVVVGALSENLKRVIVSSRDITGVVSVNGERVVDSKVCLLPYGEEADSEVIATKK